jgi:hypothetical protein
MQVFSLQLLQFFCIRSKVCTFVYKRWIVRESYQLAIYSWCSCLFKSATSWRLFYCPSFIASFSIWSNHNTTKPWDVWYCYPNVWSLWLFILFHYLQGWLSSFPNHEWRMHYTTKIGLTTWNKWIQKHCFDYNECCNVQNSMDLDFEILNESI